MKSKLDIIFGIIACLMAFGVLLPFADIPFDSAKLSIGVMPAIWIVMVILMLKVRKRPLRNLWWVWLSVPFALATPAFLALVGLGSILCPR